MQRREGGGAADRGACALFLLPVVAQVGGVGDEVRDSERRRTGDKSDGGAGLCLRRPPPRSPSRRGFYRATFTSAAPARGIYGGAPGDAPLLRQFWAEREKNI